jgi:CheY-specific phosphatase CheX
VVNVAAGNWVSGKEVMQLLLEQKGADIQITPQVVRAIAKCFDVKTMQMLLEQKRANIQITPQVVEVAAENHESGNGVIRLLLKQKGPDV